MDQKRFILAMALSMGVLFVWQMFVAPQPGTQKTKTDAKQKATQKTDEQSSETASKSDQNSPKHAEGDEGDDDQSEKSAESDRESADTRKSDEADSDADSDQQADKAAEEQPERRDVAVRTDTMRTERFTLELTNDGGRLRSVKLLQPEQYQAKDDLVGFPEGAPHYPFETRFLKESFDFPERPVYALAEDASEVASDGSYDKLVYRYDDPRGRFRVDKIFEVDDDVKYGVKMKMVVSNKLDDVRLVDTLAVDVFGWKDPTEETSWLNFRPNQVEGVCRMSEDVEREAFSSIEEPLSYDGSVKWGAIDTRYFILAGIPIDGAEECELKVVEDDYLRTRIIHESFTIAPGEQQAIEHQLYLGPKDIDVLAEVGHKLEDSVDYGFFAFIAKPMRWALNFIYDYVPNWGWAIIVLTFLIRGVIWPINMKAYSSMERMKEIQPELEEIREKYEDDRQKLGDETMKLFRENEVSPLGGCLPMLLQMPILYGLFVMIYNSVELYQAEWLLWYQNLAVKDPFYVLPALMGITMFAQQQMSTVDQSNKQAAMMMKIMPVMFTAFMAFLPSGLVLYYFFSLLIGVGQQFWVKKKFRDRDDES